jgi:hypothetical protein
MDFAIRRRLACWAFRAATHATFWNTHSPQPCQMERFLLHGGRVQSKHYVVIAALTLPRAPVSLSTYYGTEQTQTQASFYLGHEMCPSTLPPYVDRACGVPGRGCGRLRVLNRHAVQGEGRPMHVDMAFQRRESHLLA